MTFWTVQWMLGMLVVFGSQDSLFCGGYAAISAYSRSDRWHKNANLNGSSISFNSEFSRGEGRPIGESPYLFSLFFLFCMARPRSAIKSTFYSLTWKWKTDKYFSEGSQFFTKVHWVLKAPKLNLKFLLAPFPKSCAVSLSGNMIIFHLINQLHRIMHY